MASTYGVTKGRPFLAALAGGVIVELTKSEQATLVDGGGVDTSAPNTELEKDSSMVLLDNSSFCGGHFVPRCGLCWSSSQPPQSCHGRFRNR